VVPSAEASRFFGLANIGTMGSAAVAGLLSPLVDIGNRLQANAGYVMMLVVSAVASLAGLWVVGRLPANERRLYGRRPEAVTNTDDG
jgi:MFS-type transporter involved in bile tolerance (Atg22 family)